MYLTYETLLEITKKILVFEVFNPIQDGLFQGCSRIGGGAFPSHISYIDETWHSYILPKEDPKNV